MNFATEDKSVIHEFFIIEINSDELTARIQFPDRCSQDAGKIKGVEFSGMENVPM